MSLREQIEKALNTPFDAAKQGLDESKYAGLGVYHDGPTLEKSWVVISRELNTDSGTLTPEGKWIPTPDPTARTSIDIQSDIGQTKGKFGDIVKLKNKFLNLTRNLPEGSYYLHADNPTKAKYYQRVFKDHPWIVPSGEQGGLRVKGEMIKYDTLKLNIPDKETRFAQMQDSSNFRDWRTQEVPMTDLSEDISDIANRYDMQYSLVTRRPTTKGGLHLGEVPHDIVEKEFKRYIDSLRSKTGKRVEDNSFEYEGKRYGFQDASLKDRKSRSLEADGRGWALYRAGDKNEAFEMRRFKKAGLTPYMSQAEWLRMRDIYRVAADNGLEVDHIQPLEAKGLHHPDNLQLLTRDDNRLKNSIWDPEGDNFRSRAIPWEQPIGPRTKRDVSWANKKQKWSWNNALDHTTLKHIDGFSRYGSKADALANLGFSAVSGDVAGTLMAAPGVALTTRVGQKGLYKALAKFGSQRAKSFIPGLSIAGNTADVVRYTAGGRPIQATLAGAAGVLDEMQNPISEGLATAIQFGNTVTDYLRGDYKQTTGDDVDVNRNTLRHIDVDGSYNRLLRNF